MEANEFAPHKYGKFHGRGQLIPIHITPKLKYYDNHRSVLLFAMYNGIFMKYVNMWCVNIYMIRTPQESRYLISLAHTKDPWIDIK